LLFTIDGEQITDLPKNRKRDFTRWRTQLSDLEFLKIKNELINRIDGNNVHTSSWIPGTHWGGTVFEPLYHACNKNETHAAFFFGLILFHVMIEHNECWSFGKFDLNGKSIKGLTYFKIVCP
jgi:hypothetical protein